MCREFTLLCRRLDLFGGELIAIDGSKFRADNSRKRNFNPPKLERIIKALDERITAYLAEVERQDAAEPSAAESSVEGLRAKIEQLGGRKQFHEEIAERLRESGAQEISLTDPDSRLMTVGQGLGVCYNVQTAVDSKHKLIVHHALTNAHTDEGCLVEMATTAKDMLEVETLKAVADKGYYPGEEVKRCEEQGIVTFIPKVRVVLGLKNQRFRVVPPSGQRWYAARSSMRCVRSANNELSFHTVSDGDVMHSEAALLHHLLDIAVRE